MITDQRTIDALKELNYSQVYEKGKEDARQEILDKIDKFLVDNWMYSGKELKEYFNNQLNIGGQK